MSDEKPGGTRITVGDVLSYLAAGMSEDEIPQGPAPFAQTGVFNLLDAFEQILKRTKVKDVAALKNLKKLKTLYIGGSPLDDEA